METRKNRLIIAALFAIFFLNGVVAQQSLALGSDTQSLTISQEGGTTAWDTPLVIPTCNTNGTTVDLIGSNVLSRAIVLTNWGFSIPTTATIVRIVVNFTRYQNSTASVRDSNSLCLQVSSINCQAIPSLATSYLTSPTTSSYTVTTTLPTISFVNGNTFGVKFGTFKSGGGGTPTTVTLECVTIEVFYNVPITSEAITTGSVTTALTTRAGPISTGLVTTGINQVTTGGAGPITTSVAQVTTDEVTSGVFATTGLGIASTTSRVAVTTSRTAITTSRAITSGRASTTGIASSTSPGVTTQDANGSTSDGNALSPSESEGKKSNIPIIAGAAGGGVALILIIIIVALVAMRGRKSSHKKLQSYPSMISEMGLMKTPKLSENPIKGPGKTYSSVKDVGVASDQNSRFRKQMEDEHVIVDKFGGVDTDGFFAVYDGHGGRTTAEYVRDHLHENILKEASTKPIPEALKDAYIKTDKELKAKGEKSGCTAATAIIKKTSDGKRTLFVANAGDARITLRRGGKGVRLTKDHKVTDEEEVKRIEARGGMIFGGKVGASLAVTRAFGDSEMRDWVVAEAQLNQTDLTPDDTHLIVACDGLWDVVSDQEAVDLIGRDYTAQESADKLLQYALAHETKDNVSVIVLKL